MTAPTQAPCAYPLSVAVGSIADRIVEAELTWYFLHSRDDLLPPSNFGRMVAAIGERAEQSASRDSDSWHQVTASGSRGLRAREDAVELDDRLLKRLDREYPLRRVLAALGPRMAEVLEAGCSWSLVGLEAFGVRAPLAPLTRSARQAWLDSATSKTYGEWLVRLSWRVRGHAGGTQPADRILAAQVAREALSLWREAMSSFRHLAARYADLRREQRREASAEARARQVEA